ncbi:MAG: dihydropyrimidinase [Planctomycetota bacterium]
MKTLIRGGRLITADRDEIVDVLIDGEQVSQIDSSIDIDADEVIDASGKWVMPGFIDPHVHIYLPFMGTYAKDDYDSGSRAALVGGTTTIIEMCCPSQDDDPWEAFELWRGKAEGLSACDFSFHMGVSRFDESTREKLLRIVDEGITSLKVFLAYKGAFALEDSGLYEVCQLAKENGLVVTAHCENAELVASLQAQLIADGRVGPEYHEPSRPVRVETEGVHHFCTFLEMTGATGYIVHTSCRDAVETAKSFQDRGVAVDIETVIPYLTLDSTAAEQPDFEGAKYVMSPPIRSAEHQAALWASVADGTIATVATDHAPFDFEDQKKMGQPPEGNFTLIPNGIPSIEHRVRLLYTEGVVTGRIEPKRFVELASTNAAKIFGMHPSKGDVVVGGDADVVVWDPDHRETLSAGSHIMNTDYDAFEGVEVQGLAERVWVRGKLMVSGGKFVGELGHGRLVPRKKLAAK